MEKLEMSNHKPLLIELPLEIKTYDIDFAGIVSNIVYIRWLEDMRLEMLKRYFPLEGQLKQGFGPILSSTKIEYKRPLNINSIALGRMWMSALDTRRWTVSSEIMTNDKIAALAEQVGLFVSLSDGRPVPMPDEVISTYQKSLNYPT